MQNFIKKSALLFGFFLISFFILWTPKSALAFASIGLNAWFQNMIPTLFPFMVLTGIMIRMQLTEDFARFFRPILFPLLRLPKRCLYVIAAGFFCGFPIGAKITGDMYRLQQLSKKEASFLLAFCNNIGPVFFTGFVLSYLPNTLPLSGCLLGMYGIPFVYGIFLRYFVYGNYFSNPGQLLYCKQKPPSFATALDEAISSAIQSITKLGGYMIFFNLLNLIPQLLFHYLPHSFESFRIFCCLLLEITGGIKAAGSHHPVLILSMLQFGGLSCFAQTYSMISDTDLSMCRYLLHKLCRTALAFAYYSILVSHYL